MATFYKTAAAVCLVALSGLQSEAAQTTYKFKVANVDDSVYLAANLVRNGRLPVHISEVAPDSNLVSTVQGKVQACTASKQPSRVTMEACEALMKASDLRDIFYHTFDYTESPDYRELMQAALDEGLKVFKKQNYGTDWQTIWASEAGANLAYLLGSNSTKIGCVIGECTEEASRTLPGAAKRGVAALSTDLGEAEAKKAVLFCALSPEAQKNTAPFDEEYFTALISRTALLANMTQDDLKVPTNDGIAAAAVPSILATSLVAMLTALSA
ncbi:SAG family member [Eimeria brunetti]|uniref:SAG family member n=1 Tax=Eimeria brunetti TaxID=51314 RepID=U6L8W0_9EIME|nr:SAG family member [Eimeria brunetti]